MKITLMPWFFRSLIEVEHLADFFDRQRGGRLVHDHHLGVERGCARDRHGLALAAGQLFHALAHAFDMNSEVIEMRLGMLGAGLLIHQRQEAKQLAGLLAA